MWSLEVKTNQDDPFLSNTLIFILHHGMMPAGDTITTIEKAIQSLRKGHFVLIYDNDSRERETDLVIASQFVTPEAIQRMRKDGGGLIFLMISNPIAQKLKLPFLAELYSKINTTYPVLKALVPNDIPYDTKSSFSLYINHRKTFTGITDNDRSLTMKRFADLVRAIKNKSSNSAIQQFGKQFRSPGHIPICVASEQLLNERKGHTELVVSLLQMAGLTPVGSGCEMMGDHGKSLPKDKAQDYAKRNNLIYLEGEDIIRAWKQWSK
jgi:3,4-dihydroxy 2-butanone 4-phosphate synthase